MAYRLEKILSEDSSYQYVPHNSQTPHGLSFLKLFGNYKAQNRKREEYERIAKHFYNLGYEDGHNNVENPINQTVPSEEYELLMKLCTLMGVSFAYFINPPIIPKGYKNKYHPGLNTIKIRKNFMPYDAMLQIKSIIDSVAQDINKHEGMYNIKEK